MRISAQKRARNEARIRAAMDRLLGGDIPTGGRCDVKTLARQAGVDRTGFYGNRPYAHLRTEFEARLRQTAEHAKTPDPRDAQISRLKHQITTLNQRLAQRDQTVAGLAAFKTQALCRLAAQHDQITQLRAALTDPGNIRRLTHPHTTGPAR